MTKLNPEMDERAVAVENRAGNLAFQVTMWLLVVDLGVRGWWPELISLNGFPLDILVIMLAGGGVQTVYTARARTIGPRRVRSMALSAIVAAAVAAVVLLIVKAVV